MKFPVPMALPATALAVIVGPLIPKMDANVTEPRLDTVTWISLELPLYGVTGVTVALPASTEGCVFFGHGRITAANGDKASFRGLVAATPARGVEFYRDNGPASAFRLASTSVDALTCTDDATKASVFGTARVNGGGSVQDRIDVQLTAWERGGDTYRIRLSSGYDSGAQKIRHGDVEIRLHSSEHHHHDANAGRYQPGASQDGG